MKRTTLIVWALLLLSLMSLSLWADTTGKIAGLIKDAKTGEPIPGANVVIAGTSLGTVTDLRGEYTILRVPPGVYEIFSSCLGYMRMSVSQATVRIDQTTRLDFKMSPQVIEGETVTIVAERKAVQVDVSTSETSVSAIELKALPVTSVAGVVGLQAGIQGLDIRGSGADKSLFMVDGITMRDPRNNQPISSLPLTAVQEFTVKRGGFEAEYGQVQAGIVNVVTREGEKEHYYFSTTYRYSPASPKYFGDVSPYDISSMWFKPYLDPQVAWVGTEAGWDRYTARQYPTFLGWNEISRVLMANDDPNDDLSPAAAQQVFLYERRRKPIIDKGDYEMDGGFGGPVPLIGRSLGNLRFFASYNRNREQLLVPLTRDDYLQRNFQTQFVSDISSRIKLRFNVMAGKQYLNAQNWSQSYYLRYGNQIAGDIGAGDESLFSTGHYSPADISNQTFSTRLTHTLSSRTYYEASVEHVRSKYYVRAADARNTTNLVEVVPGYFLNEFPYGYSDTDQEGIVGIGSMHSCRMRDYTTTNATSFKADITSQINFQHQLKAGVEYVYNTLNLDYGIAKGYNGQEEWAQRVQRTDHPMRAALFLQDKVEAKGLIVNLGLRMDYSNSNTDWYDVGMFDDKFYSAKYTQDSDYATKKTEGQVQWSPRLGISHPITANSKLFFNYGHFKQMPRYESIFNNFRASSGLMQTIGDPNLTLAKTVAYELGYDHSLQNDFLIQLAAYYKDISDQEMTVNYYGLKDVGYSKVSNNGYSDIRGFEVTLRKTRGLWWSGFANYTYQVSTSGHFDRARIYQDPSQQLKYDRATQNLYQDRPIPRPYGRMNLIFTTPDKFGPRVAGYPVLDGLMLNLLASYQDGGYDTWNPQDLTITQNVKRVDYFDLQLRLSKRIRFKKVDLDCFIDLYNALNTKRLAMESVYDYQDQLDYMGSLHLPASEAYDNIPGDDKIGSYRDLGVAFQPIERRGKIDYTTETGENGLVYWERQSKRYVEYVNGAWQDVAKNRMDKILDEKAYIDMPNETSFNFLNPRDIFFGVRATFNF
jgi:outer membrane receptor protein involved in Fe transport